MPRKGTAFLLLLLLLVTTLSLSADSRRRAVTPAPASSSQHDALGIGPMSGASIGGTVASVSGTTIVLNTGAAAPILVDASSARFATRRSATASLASVKPGERIIAFIRTSPPVQPGTPLVAQWILVESAADLSLSGQIDMIDAGASTFTVLGISLRVDSATTYSSAFPTFAPILGLADLAAGQFVSVTARFHGSSIVAESVHVLAPHIQQTTMISGTVKSIGTTAWTITRRDGTDVEVRVNTETRIVGDPVVGNSVQVMAKVESGAIYVALAIVKLPAGPAIPDVRLEFRGTVKSISSTEWIVASSGMHSPDLVVRITSETLVYPNPQVGDRVMIVGTRESDGTFRALVIVRWL